MSSIALPRRDGSRVSHVETVVYETDRDNAPGVELPGITMVEADWDIDRSGSKSRIDISTNQRVLRDGMWVAPYLRITPEVGDTIYEQLGHFRLQLPRTVIDGTVDEWGADRIEQHATGTDIVDLLANASLPFTFYTPRNGHVMSDVHALIKLATAGVIGTNMFTNGGFEQEAAGWVGPVFTSGSGAFSWSVSEEYGAPEGKKVFSTLFNTSNPAGGAAVIRTLDIPIRQGARYMYATGFRFGLANSRMYLEMRFFDESKNLLGRTSSSPTGTPVRIPGRWVREFMVVEVPEQAFYVQMWVWSVDLIGGRSAGCFWDDIRMSTVSTMPISDDRINLPPSSAVATTRIQTVGGSSIGYDAINADRLSAIGHHAIYTDLTGRLTSSPTRDLASATVARTYSADDYRLVGAYEVERSAANRYNTVTAVKESFEEGVPPLFVTVWNSDPSDPWSVHHLGNVRYPNGPLMVQDAVDTAALETAALATLARATEQHVLRIQVLPDPTIRVHDVIEVTGGPEEAQGRWMIEYIRPGLSAIDPIVELGCRRTLSQASVSGTHPGGY